jgi:class 3 adenylate cyclase
LSYVEAVVEAETGYLFNKRYFELQREAHAKKVRSSMHNRIGINTGYCTVGNFGGEDRMDYTAR